MLQYVWLVPVLPAVSSVAIAALARRVGDKMAYVGTAAIGLATLLSLGAFIETVRGAVYPGLQFDWVQTSQYRIPIGIQLDHLAAVTLPVVSIVSLMVHIYSLGYMHGDKRFTRYYAVLSLFTAGMLALVVADNFFLLLVAWEIMGLCSYLLIGHWYESQIPQEASLKAFLTTRVGDIGLMTGVWALFAATGSLNFSEIAAAAAAGKVAAPVLLTAGLLIFSGGVGKSAQFPLHTWLPDAMAGPTPASSLIHAATMVAAGVYLVARSFAVFAAAPPGVLMWVAVIGGFTALFAATIATLRTDIKQVLAYSTISQLGYMMMALGTGYAAAAAFHLVTHAFFKALLFQCSGSVIHAVHSQEMHEMGGLRKKLPVTFWTWMAGTAALAGVPFFSGFYSKDEILLGAFNFSHRLAEQGLPSWIGTVIFVFGVAAAFLTAYYMTRATVLTFFGQPRDHHKYDHAHESPTAMTVPLIILAAFSIGIGWPSAWFIEFVAVPGAILPHHSSIVPVLAISAALLGIIAGYAVYSAEIFNRSKAINVLGPLYVIIKNKYYVDELYHAVAVAGALAISKFVGWFDLNVIDRIVNFVGLAGQVWAELTGAADSRVVDGIVNWTALITAWLGAQIRRAQTGLVQSYMLTMAVMAVIGVIIFQMIGG